MLIDNIQITGVTMSADQPRLDLPEAFALAAAYPNPFNSQTRLTFSVPLAGPVNLTVFDFQGRLVTELVQGNLASGAHSVVWNPGQAAAGCYLVRLDAASLSQTQRVMLLK